MSTTILYLGHTGKLGGAEVALTRLMGALDRERFRPVVVFAEEGPAPELMRTTGVETHVLPLSGKVREVRKDALGPMAFLNPGRLAMVAAYASRISRFARDNGVQLIHTNSLKAHIYGGLAGKLSGIPVVWHLRDFIDESYLPGAAVRVIRFLAKTVPAHLVTDSQSVMDQLHLPKGSRKATAVLNGIPIAELPAPDALPDSWNQPVRIGLLGRIAPWKGQHIFLQAAAALRQAGHEARFLVIGAPLFGEHAYEAELHGLARSLGVESEVEFLGFRKDVPALLRGLDILVHASTSADPCPSTVLEGMAHGLPVVGSNGGGVPEMIVDGETGLLVPMGDAVAMAKALQVLLADPPAARRMGRAGHARVRDHFTTARVARQMEQVYTDILSPRARTS